MINIASLYYFTLLQRHSAKYKRDLIQVCNSITQYLEQEDIMVHTTKKQVSAYECISYTLEEVGQIHLFHKQSRQQKHFYYPSFFCDIYIHKSLLDNSQDKKRVIFLLSNIFECFDEFEEKNLMIEFHRGIEQSYSSNKHYELRYDFMNINSLAKIYAKKDIAKEIQHFVQESGSISVMSDIKNKFPETYRTLLFFVYNIFAMQKTIISTNHQLAEIQKYEENSGENMHISLSEERLKLNKKSLKKNAESLRENLGELYKYYDAQIRMKTKTRTVTKTENIPSDTIISSGHILGTTVNRIILFFSTSILKTRIQTIYQSEKGKKSDNLPLWKRYDRDKNFLNHHNYYLSQSAQIDYKKQELKHMFKSAYVLGLGFATFLSLIVLPGALFSDNSFGWLITVFFVVFSLVYLFASSMFYLAHITENKNKTIKIHQEKMNGNTNFTSYKNKIFFY